MDKRVSAIIQKGANLLEKAGVADAKFEATLLLRYMKKWQLYQLLMNTQESLSHEEIEDFLKLVQLRETGYPLQYITGIKEFMGMELEVSPHVLIPRYDTEVLVEAVLKKKLPDKAKVVDIGTGSGAIAVSLAKFKPEWEIYAVDISEAALEIARRNASKHNAKVVFFQGDLLEPIKKAGIKPDLVVSNPPYIPLQEIAGLMKEVQFEPHLALQGGEDGLDLYRRLIPQAYSCLNEQGYIALEMGYDQGQALKELCKSAGFQSVEIIKDYQSHDRVIMGTRY